PDEDSRRRPCDLQRTFRRLPRRGHKEAGRSCDRLATAVFRAIPGAIGEDAGQNVDGAPDVALVDIERREAETHPVGRPEIADYALRDQGLHRRVAVLEAKGDLRTPHRRIARAGEPQRWASSLDLPNEEFGERDRTGANLAHVDPVPYFERGFENAHLHHRRGADPHPRDPLRRGVAEHKIERGLMAE